MTNSVCFLILHYGKNVRLTIDAIRSVQKQSFEGDKDIIIVCNGQEYDIKDEIKENFGNDLVVIVLPENIGFSKGNNIGYSEAKKRKDYDFILCMNNDIIIKDTSFVGNLYEEYKNELFYVAGPDVYTPYIDAHFSPLSNEPITSKEIEYDIDTREKLVHECDKRFSFSVFKHYLRDASCLRNPISVYYRLCNLLRKKDNSTRKNDRNCVLCGAFLIFSRDFILANEKAFEPEVFLYYEEHYLTRKCLSHHWPIRYLDSLQVEHYHRGSSGFKGLSYSSYSAKKKEQLVFFINAAKNYNEML